MKLKPTKTRRNTTSIDGNQYVAMEKGDGNRSVYIPNFMNIYEYLISISPSKEELRNMTTYDPMGEERNRLMGPAAFMADPKGYYRWVRTVGLPSLNPPEMSEQEIEDNMDEGYSAYLSGRPDNFINKEG